MTSNSHQTLERIARRVPVPEPAYDRLLRRRDRKARNRRVSAAALAIAIALLSITGLIRAFRTPQRPAHQPVSKNIFSGLGGWIAYNNYGGIWATDPQRPGLRKQLSTGFGTPIAWSSDGSKLLIFRPHGGLSGKDSNVREALYVLNADGSQTLLIDVGNPYSLSGGSFSPDGSNVVYAHGLGIYVIDSAGGKPRLIRTSSLGPYAATFSPDGSKIAYFAGGGDHDNSLWVMNADGSGSRVLLPDAGMMKSSAGLRSLGWSPDGTRLVFGMGYGPYWIYVVGADGSGLTRVIADGIAPFWSPDGSRIAFDPYKIPGPFQAAGPLAIANADGTHIQRFDYTSSGPWNPLPPRQPATQNASATAGATGAGTPTYAIALLTIVGCVAIWRHRKHKRWEQLAEEIE